MSEPKWITKTCTCGRTDNYLPTVSGQVPCSNSRCHKLLSVPKVEVNTTPIGIVKLKSIMNIDGYKKVSKRVGVSQSLLFQYCSGERDPLAMKMRTAIRFKLHYNIEFMEWSETAS